MKLQLMYGVTRIEETMYQSGMFIVTRTAKDM